MTRSSPGAKIEIRSQPSARLVSLDTFRGITITAMLLVNHPGNHTVVYAPLEHAEWHGWTPTDLIFPFFLFIVGVALTFSLRKQLERGARRGQILARTAKRAVILIGLGLLISSFPWWRPHLSTLRIPGVLQRIGLTYLVATPLVLWLGMRGQAIVGSALLLGYWALLTWAPVPGVGAGLWEPAQDLGAYIDRAVFGINHLSPGTWDPEGLLSTFPAAATVLLGALAGQWLQSNDSTSRKTIGMLVAGAAAIALGVLWGQVFPINKNLWTSSFTIFTAGMALILLAGCYWLVEVKDYRRWGTPFIILGVNAITVYVVSELVHRMLARIRIQSLGITSLWKALYEYLFASWLSPYNASLAFAIAYALVWFALVMVLYKKDIRVHV
jgi:predicted acyltransferase